VTFDGEQSRVAAGGIFDPDAAAPTGSAQVLDLTLEERESINYSTLNNLLFPLSEAIEEGSAELLLAEELERLDGFRGRRLVYTVDGDTGRYTVDQSAVLDDSTRTLYVFVVGCAEDCYQRHKGVIDDVVGSWTVKER
jgi:hypothetical protein